MRAYPQNSPQAAARIVALTMLCDGHLSKAEIDAVHAQGIEQRLGLRPGQWQAVMRELCEDLLTATDMSWHANCGVDAHMLAGLLAEVSDPALRLEVLRLCLAVVDADAHMTEGEQVVMSAAVEQ